MLIIGAYKSSVECDSKRNNNRFSCIIPPRRKRCQRPGYGIYCTTNSDYERSIQYLRTSSNDKR
jgi:hypothetical protein